MGSLRAFAKLVAFALISVILLPFQIAVLAVAGRGRAVYALPRKWHATMCCLFGIRVVIEGMPLASRQALFVGNHLSYLDILAIGSVLEASFVAKVEVASWPVFGFLSKLQQTAFISRSRATLQNDKYALGQMLAAGRSLIIFPEGTSTDGQTVLPFKSSLFSLALETKAPLLVQPMTLALTAREGRPVATQADRDYYTWHGDMTLAPHLWAFATGQGVTLTLRFHPPLDPAAFTDRKLLAQACHEACLSGLLNKNVENAVQTR